MRMRRGVREGNEDDDKDGRWLEEYGGRVRGQWSKMESVKTGGERDDGGAVSEEEM